MSLSKVIDKIGKINLADGIDEDVLKKIGERIKRQFDEDWQSMSDWRHALDKSKELMKQEFTTKSSPWDGASNLIMLFDFLTWYFAEKFDLIRNVQPLRFTATCW